MGWIKQNNTYYTPADIENAILKANKVYFQDVEKMCDKNIKEKLTEHLLDKTHFDKPSTSVLYRMIESFKAWSTIKYVFGVPLFLLVVERILNVIGIIPK